MVGEKPDLLKPLKLVLNNIRSDAFFQKMQRDLMKFT